MFSRVHIFIAALAFVFSGSYDVAPKNDTAPVRYTHVSVDVIRHESDFILSIRHLVQRLISFSSRIIRNIQAYMFAYLVDRFGPSRLGRSRGYDLMRSGRTASGQVQNCRWLPIRTVQYKRSILHNFMAQQDALKCYLTQFQSM